MDEGACDGRRARVRVAGEGTCDGREQRARRVRVRVADEGVCDGREQSVRRATRDASCTHKLEEDKLHPSRNMER